MRIDDALVRGAASHGDSRASLPGGATLTKRPSQVPRGTKLRMVIMIEAVRSLTPRYRDDLVIVLAKAFFHPGMGGFRLESFVDKWLSKLGLEWTDLLLQSVGKPQSPGLMDRLHRLQETGKERS